MAVKFKTVTENMLITLTLSIITTLTMLLNSSVISAICTTKKLHQPANYLICSLAVTDLLVAVLVMPLSITYIVMERWTLGHFLCEIWLSIDMTCCTCSILHLCVIALDRIYHAAKHLYQKRGSSRHLSSRSTDSQNSFASCKLTQTFCVSDFSTSDPTTEFDRMNASVRTPSSDNDLDLAEDRQQISSVRERKAARILGLILSAFILSWLPFFIKELIVGVGLITVSMELGHFLTWLGYVNSLINPLLYTSFNEDFKLAFKKLVKCW
ncbi:UNVERIFIED_CONTAM: 5-hydroxytryptamine receptor 1E [Gekko kuhli]